MSGGGLSRPNPKGVLPPANSTSAGFQGGRKDRGGAGDQTADNAPPVSGDDYGDAGWGEFQAPAGYAIGVPAYGDPFPSDSGDEIVPIAVRDPGIAAPEDPPDFEYDYGEFADVKVPDPNLDLTVYPCKVKDRREDEDGFSIYDVEAFRFGLKERATKMKGVKQLQIDKEDVIPEDTWTFVVVNTWVHEGSIQREASIQVPVWLY